AGDGVSDGEIVRFVDLQSAGIKRYRPATQAAAIASAKGIANLQRPLVYKGATDVRIRIGSGQHQDARAAFDQGQRRIVVGDNRADGGGCPAELMNNEFAGVRSVKGAVVDLRRPSGD